MANGPTPSAPGLRRRHGSRRRSRNATSSRRNSPSRQTIPRIARRSRRSRGGSRSLKEAGDFTACSRVGGGEGSRRARVTTDRRGRRFRASRADSRHRRSGGIGWSWKRRATQHRSRVGGSHPGAQRRPSRAFGDRSASPDWPESMGRGGRAADRNRWRPGRGRGRPARGGGAGRGGNRGSRQAGVAARNGEGSVQGMNAAQSTSGWPPVTPSARRAAEAEGAHRACGDRCGAA